MWTGARNRRHRFPPMGCVIRKPLFSSVFLPGLHAHTGQMDDLGGWLYGWLTR